MNPNDAIIDEKMRIDRVPFLRPTPPSSEDEVVWNPSIGAEVLAWPAAEYDLRLDVVGEHLRPTACNGDLVQVVGCSGREKQQWEQFVGQTGIVCGVVADGAHVDLNDGQILEFLNCDIDVVDVECSRPVTISYWVVVADAAIGVQLIRCERSRHEIAHAF